MKRLIVLSTLAIFLLGCTEKTHEAEIFNVLIMEVDSHEWHTFKVNGEKLPLYTLKEGYELKAVDGATVKIELYSVATTVNQSFTIVSDCTLLLYFEGGKFIFYKY